METSAYVAEVARRGGLGRQLYERLLHALRRQGYVKAFAGIALPNPASVALHQSVGFEPAGVFRAVGFKLGRWHDVGWWRHHLQELPSHPRPPTPPCEAWT